MFNRNRLINQLKSQPFWDVIIIGGGATGLGIALDCATRNYKTLLLEQVDFAKGTSSRSTKLVHGGVRYLAQGNIDLVKEALYERGLMLKNASHIVSKQSFIIPNYKWWDNLLYTIGLKVYDFLAGKLSFGKSVRISKNETQLRLQTIKEENLKGGVVYQDGQFDDSRLAINLAQSAIEHGATVLNHFKVEQLLKNEKGIICGVVAKDAETYITYTLNAKLVINATGVFTDNVLKMDDARAKNIIRPSQGVHLVLDKSFLPGKDAIMIPKTEDGRVLFLVPWHHRVLVGTTDTLLESHSLEPRALKKEVDFILSAANKYLKKTISKKDVLSVFVGLRPLAAPKNKAEKTKEISRSHKIIVSNSGLITITGGKWTTYRRMAQDTLSKAIEIGKLPNVPCKTKDLLIHGANGVIDKPDHLSIYGTDRKAIKELINEFPEWGKKLHPRLEFLKAEVIWAVRNEMARTIEDVLARRVRILFLDAKAALEIAPQVATILGKELNKNKDWELEQIASFTKTASHYLI
ncbi:MAG: glycerol-3-phosphate dehydrogenase/oxidase [Flavobacteriales bacterium]|nr:glycerol-3-phosphate dehydrogenase/oxidase [Flavobacteriia bacterium]NCP89517.1 glycerol-3-phosphate dehydrogenase/oxidase [Flavobacteriales bacterium]PIV94829.1 MAG: FAD-dependent oxidoreductase [Flavobacteriaceae bacterium CG17_big_fil_post_rev_8_21_14_2_50_33_15]PIY12689.1 MAG: FAD-dependent oxidoreductase [Flavobacteriaceae bacterium CG_4_10_14_3_um_filter_33_47]PJB17159.1 MAG: FAD-dependent oxidoreductase [Flavobacteriaceae bacterium CG_4_9_14_3_um_filter_33_16]